MTPRYTNLDGSRSVKLLKMVKRVLRRKKTGVGTPAPQTKPKIHELKKPVMAKHDLHITWLGHSGWLIQLNTLNILIDPVLAKKLGGVVKSRAKFQAPVNSLPKIDLVLISHDHYDHLSKRLLKKLQARVVAGVGTGALLKSKKLQSVELKWWENITVNDVKITFVPSQHSSRRGLLDSNRRLWGGFVIEASGGIKIYHAGDSAYFSGFKNIYERFPNIDIAFLPIGGYGPEKLRCNNHLTPEQAVQAFIDVGAKYMFPMHWGSFRMSDEPLDEPPKRLIAEWHRKKINEKKLIIMPVGETKIFRNNIVQ